MKIIQTHKDFYVELSNEEVRIYTRSQGCSIYPVWLGKNRAVLKEVIKYFEKNPPSTLVDCLHIIGHFELAGIGGIDKPVESLFDEEKTLDNNRIFW